MIQYFLKRFQNKRFSQKISEQKIFSKDFRTNEIQYYNAADVGGDESLFGTYYFILGDGDQKKS